MSLIFIYVFSISSEWVLINYLTNQLFINLSLFIWTDCTSIVATLSSKSLTFCSFFSISLFTSSSYPKIPIKVTDETIVYVLLFWKVSSCLIWSKVFPPLETACFGKLRIRLIWRLLRSLSWILSFSKARKRSSEILVLWSL